jgi:methyl-accepting chemotaxis protein
METFKRALAVIGAILAVIGIIAGLLGIWFSWSYNTPVTESLVRIAEGAERVLSAAGDGLERVDNGLGLAAGAVQTLDETVRTAGETIVDTSLAFVVLERTVGDTLFPRLLAAQETVRSVTDTIVAFNQTLEAANNLPFLEVPTLTTELETAAGRLETARARVEEIQAAIRETKEEKVAQPVAFITDRTGPIIENLEGAQTTVQEGMARMDAALERLSTLRSRLPRLIDMVSITLTLALLWLVAAQGFVLVHAYEYLSGKRINWRRLKQRAPEDTVAME